MLKVVLLGEPKSTQSIYKIHSRGKFATLYMSKVGKDIKDSYQWQARSQVKISPLEGDLTVSMEIYVGTKRKCDIDNFNKLCFDAMSGVLWIDDSQIKELHIKKSYDKENPRIVLQVSEL